MIIKKSPADGCGRASFCLEFAGKMKEVLHKSEGLEKKEGIGHGKIHKKEILEIEP